MLRRSFLSYLPFGLAGLVGRPETPVPEEILRAHMGNATLLIKDGVVFCKIIHCSDGNEVTHWLNSNGEIHREDGPAITRTDGYQAWFINGKHHRVDGPAIITADGEAWYHHGKLHRIDGPAIITADGEKHWYQNGMHHREDGPAIECANGSQSWYHHEKLHRIDGPAIESNGYQAWYIHGRGHRIGGPAVITHFEEDGRYLEQWLEDGLLHREDGPAITWSDGRCDWYIRGEFQKQERPTIKVKLLRTPDFSKNRCHIIPAMRSAVS